MHHLQVFCFVSPTCFHLRHDTIDQIHPSICTIKPLFPIRQSRPAPGKNYCISASQQQPIPGIVSSESDLQVDWDSPIASGSFGDVFFGVEIASGRPVMIKKASAKQLAEKLLSTEKYVNEKLAKLKSSNNVSSILNSVASKIQRNNENSDQQDSYTYDASVTANLGLLNLQQQDTSVRWPLYIGSFKHKSNLCLCWYREGDGSTLENFLSGRPLSALYSTLGIFEPNSYGPLRMQLSKKVTGELLRALVEMQSQGIMHRDIKPANIVISPNDSRAPLKIIDFGSACDWNSLFKRGLSTDTCDPIYAAPEQKLSMLGPDRFDVYSVGLIAIRILAPSITTENDLVNFRKKLETFKFKLFDWLAHVSDSGESLGADLAERAMVDIDVENFLSLIEGMLAGNVMDRLSAKKALNMLNGL